MEANRDDTSMSLSLHVAATFVFPFEADMARLRLAWEGISARLADEAVAGWFWHYSNAAGGVKVLVRTEDLLRALEILGQRPAAEGGASIPSRAGGLTATQEPLSAASEEEPAGEDWICPKCREKIPGGWDVCWSCGTTLHGREDSRSTPAEDAGSSPESGLPGDSPPHPDRDDDQPAHTSQSEPIPTPIAQRWGCPHCGVRVPNDMDVCWACGTTHDGQVDPEFEAADAQVVEYDLSQPPSLWWPLLCVLFPPLLVYDVCQRCLPSAPELRRKRRSILGSLDPRLRRACRLAVLAIGWFPPFAIPSLWLIGTLDVGKGAQQRRSDVFAMLAVAIDVLYAVPFMALIAISFMR
jgi:hypothetical protein